MVETILKVVTTIEVHCDDYEEYVQAHSLYMAKGYFITTYIRKNKLEGWRFTAKIESK